MLKKIAFAVIAIVLCLTLSLGVSAVEADTVFADSSIESQVQPRYSYTSLVTTSLKDSSGNANCGASLVGYDGITTKIQITMTLQKKSLLWWSEVQEWTLTANDFIASFSKTKAVGSGKYRVKAVYKVYSGSASESITDYSATVEF